MTVAVLFLAMVLYSWWYELQPDQSAWHKKMKLPALGQMASGAAVLFFVFKGLLKLWDKNPHITIGGKRKNQST